LERLEDALTAEHIQWVAGSDFDHAAKDVGVEAVCPSRARLVQKRHGGDSFGVLGRGHFGLADSVADSRLGVVLAERRRGDEAIGDAGSMRQQVANRYRMFRRYGGELSALLLAWHQDLTLFESGDVSENGIVRPQLPLIDEDHGSDAGDRLGH